MLQVSVATDPLQTLRIRFLPEGSTAVWMFFFAHNLHTMSKGSFFGNLTKKS